MVRKLAAALLSAGVLIPGLANALGLGEIKLNSALSEPLNAEIQLVQVRELTKDEILPNLASTQDFKKAGVERFHYLSDVRFEVVVNEDGRSYIKVKSRKPIREPFVNFLVEVHWPAGRLLREYTLLLDPPLYSQTAPATMKAPAAAARPTAQATPKPSAQMSPSAAPSRSSQPSTSSSRASQPASPGEGGTYGPTNSSDSLWSIAKALKPSNNVSMQQTMVAIQQLNPDAFINGNINLLKKGQVLRGPSEQQAQAFTNREAMQMVAEQNRAWRNRTTERDSGSTAEAAQIDTSGRSEGSFERKVRNEEGRLKLVTETSDMGASSSSAEGGAGNSASSGTRRLDLAEEKADQFKLENEDLKVKLSDLEEQVETSEKVLNLKDDQIAALQARLAELEKQVQNAAQKPGMATDTAEAAKPTPDQTEKVPTPVPDQAMSQAEMGETQEAAEVDYNFEEETPANVPQQPIVVENVEQKLVAPEQPKPAVVTPPEKDLIQEFLENPMYWAAAGGVVVVLVGLLLLAGRKREEEDEFNEALVEDFSLDQQPAEGDSVEAAAEEAEDFFAEQDEEADEVETVQQTGDVIGEADIYIAYGRFPQAIEMLESAVENEPGRNDVRMKLLEVCAEANEAETFNKHYQQVMTLPDSAAKDRANELREKLGIAAEQDQDMLMPDSELGDFDIETEVSVEDPDDETFVPEVLDTKAAADVAGLDFDLNLDIDAVDQGQEIDEDSTIVMQPVEDAPTDNSLDFSFDAEDVAEEQSTTNEAAPDAENLMDFDGEFSLDEQPESLAADIDAGDADLEIDLDLSDSLEPVDEGESLEFSLDSEPDDTVVDSVEDATADPTKSDDVIDSSAAAQLADELDLDADFDLGTDDEVAGGEVSQEEVGDETLVQGDFSSDATVDDQLEPSEDNADYDAADIAAGFETPAVTAAPVSELAANEGEELDFLTDADETSTKLDLARAYIDMGDREGAKDILDEVLIEGNNDQQSEAQDLLAKLG